MRKTNTLKPITLSTRHLEDKGYLVDRSEYKAGLISHDLFGLFDLVALDGSETIGIQVTSRSNISSRIKRLTEHENIGRVKTAGWRVLVHGWDYRDGIPRLKAIEL